MAKKGKNPPLKHGLPSLHELKKFLSQFEESPPLAEVARAFHIRGDERRDLKRLMREAGEGSQRHERGKEAKHHRGRDALPPVGIVDIIGITPDGELIGRPDKFHTNREPPRIIVEGSGHAKSLTIGDRALAKLERTGANRYVARVIRALPKQTVQKLLGVVSLVGAGALVAPVHRKDQRSYFVSAADLNGAEDGELVEIEALPGGRAMGDIPARIVRRIGFMDEANAASTIAVHRHEIPTVFSAEAVAIAEASAPPLPEGRTDLREIPLVTIDGEDARDFDDAVFAEPDTDPGNPGGWHLIVAIADVAHYVVAGSALDRNAFERGNSVYFPDMVVPMLPEALSNGLCSLKPEEDRYCLAVHLWIDAAGERLRYQFVRGIMRSHQRLTYTRAQEVFDSLPSKPQNSSLRGAVATRQSSPSSGDVASGGAGLPRFARNDEEKRVANLYGGYAALGKHIDARAPLDLNLPEHKVRFDAEGQVEEVYKVARLDSHRLIEAYMIAANVAAADELTRARMGAIFRIHDAPDLGKLTTLKEMLKGSTYHFNPTAEVRAGMFNKLLRQAEEKGEVSTIHTAVLRSQMQAIYGPSNSGHFGLALASYCHFTSPIRRYADLIVHRALIRSHKWTGEDGIDERDLKRLPEIGEHVSNTERRAMKAEREAMERYLALYMAEKVGGDFAGHISGVTSVGLFIELSDNGAQGFVPRGTLGEDFFTFDERRQQLVGRRTNQTFRLGQQVRVVLEAADIVTGSLRMSIAGTKSRRQADRPSPPRRKGRRR